MRNSEVLDSSDARLVLALNRSPRASVQALAVELGLARNTVQARLSKLERTGALTAFTNRLDPAALGYPMTAFITVRVTQQMLDEVGRALAAIPEVVEVFGMTGDSDLLVRTVATDAEDLYRIAGRILATPGIERTSTALVMRPMVPHRLQLLVERIAQV